MKISKEILYRHLLIWFFLIWYIIYSDVVEGALIAKSVYVFLFLFNCFICYYLLLFVIFPLKHSNKFAFLVCLLFATVFFICFDFIHVTKILHYFSANTPRANLPAFEFIKSSLLFYLFVFTSSLGTYLNRRSIMRFKKIAEKEKQIMMLELSTLKDQFNSHLTFNFLNFCYSKILPISQKASESIEAFSEMLHYSLVIKPNQPITLIKEVEYIENFILIQKCISVDVFVEFKIIGNFNEFKIMPMILSVFIENSFKHGVINNSKKPIVINMEIQNDVFIFEIINDKSNQKTIDNTGFGVKNIKETLDLLYPQKHSFVINETELTYSVKLHLENTETL